MGTSAFSADQQRHHWISSTERIIATGALVLIDRSLRIPDLSTLGKSFRIVPHKSPFPTAAARRNNIGDRIGCNRNRWIFGAFPLPPWAGAGFWAGRIRMLCSADSARQFATDASSQAANRRAGTHFDDRRSLLRCHWPDRRDRYSTVACVMAFCRRSNRIRSSAH